MNFAAYETARAAATTMTEKRAIAEKQFAYVAECQAKAADVLAAGVVVNTKSDGGSPVVYTVVSVGPKLVTVSAENMEWNFTQTKRIKKYIFLSDFAIQIAENAAAN